MDSSVSRYQSDIAKLGAGLHKVRELIKRQQLEAYSDEESDFGSGHDRVHYDLALRLRLETQHKKEANKRTIENNHFQWTDVNDDYRPERLKHEASVNGSNYKTGLREVVRQLPIRKVKSVSAFEDNQLIACHGDDLPKWTTPKFFTDLSGRSALSKTRTATIARSKSESNVAECKRRYKLVPDDTKSMTNLPRENLVEKLANAAAMREQIARENEEKLLVRNCRQSKMSHDVNEVREFMRRQREERKIQESRKGAREVRQTRPKFYDVEKVHKYMEDKKRASASKSRESSPEKSPRPKNYDQQVIRQYIANQRKSRSPLKSPPKKNVKAPEQTKVRTAQNEIASTHREPRTSSPSKKPPPKPKRKASLKELLSEDELRSYLGSILNGSLDGNNKVHLPENLPMVEPCISTSTSSTASPSKGSPFKAATAAGIANKTVDSVFSELSTNLKPNEDLSDFSAENSIRSERGHMGEASNVNRTFVCGSSTPAKGSSTKSEKIAIVDPVSRETAAPSVVSSAGHNENVLTVNHLASVETQTRPDPLRVKLDDFSKKFALPDADDMFSRVVGEVSWDELFAKVFKQKTQRAEESSTSEPEFPRKFRNNYASPVQSTQPKVSPPKSPNNSFRTLSKRDRAMEIYPPTLRTSPVKSPPVLSPTRIIQQADENLHRRLERLSYKRVLDFDKSSDTQGLFNTSQSSATASSLSSSENSYSLSPVRTTPKVLRANNSDLTSPPRSVLSFASEASINVRKGFSVSPFRPNSSLESNRDSKSARINQDELRVNSNLINVLDEENDAIEDDATDNVSSITSEITPFHIPDKSPPEAIVEPEPTSASTSNSSSGSPNAPIAPQKPSSPNESVQEIIQLVDQVPDEAAIQAVVGLIAKQLFRAKSRGQDWRVVKIQQFSDESQVDAAFKLLVSDLVKEMLPNMFRCNQNPSTAKNVFDLAAILKKPLFPDSVGLLCEILTKKIFDLLSRNLDSDVETMPNYKRDGMMRFWRHGIKRDEIDTIICEELYVDKEWSDFSRQEKLLYDKLSSELFEEILGDEVKETVQLNA